ncbi:MAG: hypothetical protein NHB32_08450 [Fischerella sp. CENA71]|nr:hypothetical protein [Fischerella sp. CENA71]
MYFLWLEKYNEVFKSVTSTPTSSEITTGYAEYSFGDQVEFVRTRTDNEPEASIEPALLQELVKADDWEEARQLMMSGEKETSLFTDDERPIEQPKRKRGRPRKNAVAV